MEEFFPHVNNMSESANPIKYWIIEAKLSKILEF